MFLTRMNYVLKDHTDLPPLKVCHVTDSSNGTGTGGRAHDTPAGKTDWRIPPAQPSRPPFWPAAVSFVLHGAALALILLGLPARIPEPPSAAAPTISLEFIQPAPAEPAAEPVPQAAEAPVMPEPPPETADLQPEVEIPPPVEPTSIVVEPPPPIENTPVVEIEPEITVPEVVAPLPPPPKPRPTPRPQPVDVTPQPQRAQPRTIPAETARPAVPSPVPAAPSQPASAPPTAPVVSSEPTPDYVRLVLGQLERHKVYPRVSQQRRQQGRALIRVVIDRSGRVLSHKIEQGTGHELLDREAAAMIQRAAPLPPIPSNVTGNQLELVLPIDFFLR